MVASEPEAVRRVGRVRRAVRDRLPVTRAGRILALGTAISSAGSGAFLGSATVYFIRQAGFSPAQVGLALSVGALCGLFSPVPAGLADRIDPGRIFVGLLMARALCYGSFVLVGSYRSYVVLVCVAGILDKASAPINQLVVASLESAADRTRSLASISAMRNAGLSAGFLIAGLVLALAPGRTGFRSLFLFNGLSFVAIGLAVWASLRAAGPRSKAARAARPARSSTGGGRPRPRYLALTVGSGILSVHQSVLIVMFPAWLASSHAAPISTVPILIAVNTVLTIATEVPLARLATSRPRARRAVGASLAWLTLACLAFMVAKASGPLAIGLIVVAMVALTLGENLQSVASYELSFDMADPDHRGRHLATFFLGASGQQVLGPLLVTAVLLPAGTWAWPILIAVFVVGAVIVRWAAAEPQPNPPASITGESLLTT